MEFLAGVLVGLIVGVAGTLAFRWLAGAEARAKPSAARVPEPAEGQSELARLLGAPAAAPRQAESALDALRQKLRAMILHDAVVEERLVQAERERMPSASLTELYQAAIERLERDNR